MPEYLNAFLMLAVTLAAFVVLARLLQALRARRMALPWRGAGLAVPQRLVIEQAQALDGRRRLVLVRCDEQRVLLLTGGPADLVVAVLPPLPAGASS